MEILEILSLVKKGEPDKAIKGLILITEGMELNDMVIAISAKYRKYKRDLISGILSPSEDAIAFATITSNILAVVQEYKEESNKNYEKIDRSAGEVFISYAWGGESEIIANEIVEALKERNILVVQDKTEIKFRSSIKEFMQTIGKGKSVILVISDRYLKSKNCLYELLQTASNGEFAKRIFPVVLKDAAIFNPVDLLGYVKYWEKQIEELESAVREITIPNTHGIRDDLDLYVEIRAFLPRLVNTIADMNTLTSEAHQFSNFKQLYEAIAQNIN